MQKKKNVFFDRETEFLYRASELARFMIGITLIFLFVNVSRYKMKVKVLQSGGGGS